MATIPVVKVGPVLEPVRIETSIFLIEAADGIGAAQKSAWTCAHQAMVFGDMAGFGLAARSGASAGFADVSNAGKGLAVAGRIKSGEAVVVHVPAAIVFNFGHGMITDVPIFCVQAHSVPDRKSVV